MLTRAAGILIPLFSLRTPTDLGSGEITDLLPFSDFALAMGHRVIQLLPLTESSPGDASPYNALSTFAIDPLAIGIAELPGVSRLSVGRARRSGRVEPTYNRAHVAETKFP